MTFGENRKMFANLRKCVQLGVKIKMREQKLSSLLDSRAESSNSCMYKNRIIVGDISVCSDLKCIRLRQVI